MAPQVRTRNGRHTVSWQLGGRRSGGEFQSKTFDGLDDAQDLARIVRRHKDAITLADALRILWPELAGQIFDKVEAKEQTSAKPTVAEVVPLYINSMLRSGPEHRRKTASRFSLEVLPVVGALPVDLVEASHIEAIMKNLRTCDCREGVRGERCSRRRSGRKDEARLGHQGGLSKATQDRFYTALNAFFSFAVKRGYRQDNPVQAVDFKTDGLPKAGAARKKDLHYYMEAWEYDILLSQFSEEDKRLLEFLIHTGCRINEALAVQRQHLRVEKGTWYVDIHNTWTEGEDGGLALGKPKGGSYRTLAVLPELIEILQPNLDACVDDFSFLFANNDRDRTAWSYDVFENRWQKATLAAVRCKTHYPENRGTPTDPDELLGRRCGDNGGVNENGQKCGGWVHPGWNRCTDHLGPAPDAASRCQCFAKRLKKRPKIHDMRHTHVAWLVAQGDIHLTEIARRLGHTSTAVTEHVYSGLLKSSEAKLLGAIATKRLFSSLPTDEQLAQGLPAVPPLPGRPLFAPEPAS